MYYPCSENKGAEQLRGYREADLRLCFRIGKYPVFSRCGSHVILHLFELMIYIPANSQGHVGTLPSFYGTFTQIEDVMNSI